MQRLHTAKCCMGFFFSHEKKNPIDLPEEVSVLLAFGTLMSLLKHADIPNVSDKYFDRTTKNNVKWNESI